MIKQLPWESPERMIPIKELISDLLKTPLPLSVKASIISYLENCDTTDIKTIKEKINYLVNNLTEDLCDENFFIFCINPEKRLEILEKSIEMQTSDLKKIIQEFPGLEKTTLAYVFKKIKESSDPEMIRFYWSFITSNTCPISEDDPSYQEALLCYIQVSNFNNPKNPYRVFAKHVELSQKKTLFKAPTDPELHAIFNLEFFQERMKSSSVRNKELDSSITFESFQQLWTELKERIEKLDPNPKKN